MAASTFSVATIFSAVDRVSAPIRKMKTEVAGLQKSVKGNIDAIGGKWIERGLMAGAVGMGFLAKSAVETAAQFESIKTAITYISKTPENAAKNLEFLDNTVNTLALDYRVTAESLKRFLGAVSSTNLSADRQRDVFYKMATATRVLGMDAESTERVFYALGEMFSKGQVMSQELKMQMGNALPGAVKRFADAVGVSSKELNKMMENGEVGVDQLLKFADATGSEFAPGIEKATKTASAALTRLNTSWQRILEAIGNSIISTGILDYLNEIAGSVVKWINANKELIKQNVTALVEGLVGAFKWIYNNWDWIVAGLEAWITLWGALTIINTGLTLIKAGLVGINILLGASGIGIAVFLLAKGFLSMYDNIKAGKELLDTYKNSLKSIEFPEMPFDEYAKFWYMQKQESMGFFTYLYEGWLNFLKLFNEGMQMIGIDRSERIAEIEAEIQTLYPDKGELGADYQKYREKRMMMTEAAETNKMSEPYTPITSPIQNISNTNFASYNPDAITQKNIIEQRQNSVIDINVKGEGGATAEVVKQTGGDGVKVTNNIPFSGGSLLMMK